MKEIGGGKRFSKVAQKVVRHFPLKKRIRRLFMSSNTAPLMSWHVDGRIKDGLMRHPADAPAWKHFDAKYEWFSKEARNIRFGLATDGFNPFRTMNLSYSIWPIVLIPYNLPAESCMKENNFILSVIIPGRKAPGKDIDIYLQLVVDELKVLWKDGLWTFDAHVGRKFRVYAALLWTISDWLGRGILSGESIVVCSHCLLGTCSKRLKHGHKACYLGTRMFLPADHPFRKDKDSFDGTTEDREPPIQPSGHEISEMTKGIHTIYGKTQKQQKSKKKKRQRDEGEEDTVLEDVHTVESTFKKRSIFFQLEYWEHLLVRHNLDSMHIEKNVFDNIVHTILQVDNRSKDNVKARLDMKRFKIRTHLHVDETQEKPDLPEAMHYMNSDNKKVFCSVVKNARFPVDYASNMDGKVRLDEKKLVGLKTHDCHIIFEDVFPLAISRTMPAPVALPLINLSKYFKKVCSKVIDPTEMQKLEEEIAETMCQLEQIFPPSFFDIMEHLVIHLASEVLIGGPVQFRNMWSTEMFVGKCKGMVHTRRHPEASIAEGYIFDESLDFCARYLENSNKETMHTDDSTTSSPDTNIYLRTIGRQLSAFQVDELDHISWTQAQRHVLLSYPEITRFANEHITMLQADRRKSRREVEVAHHQQFLKWFIEHVHSLMHKGVELPQEVVLLAQKPFMMVKKYNSYKINGYTFHTRSHSAGKSSQCDGVSTTAKTLSYSVDHTLGDGQICGRIHEIVELNYSNTASVVLFKCEWVKDTGIRVDEFGITEVNFNHVDKGEILSSMPFILASQAKQVYYLQDPIDNEWFAVVSR